MTILPRRAVDAALPVLWLCLASALAAGQAPGPVLEITAPDDGAYVSGRTVLRAIVSPHGQGVERLTFYADGQVVCTLERQPFECAWDAGPGVRRHQIRAVAQLPGGSVLRRVIATRALELSESVEVDVVQVTAVVHDRDGRWVSRVPRESFRLSEDGVPQTVSAFLSEDIPLEIVVAVDISGSMTEAMPQVKLAVANFLSALRREDHVTLLAFNDNVFTIARPTADHAARLKAIERLSPWGGTAFYEAVVKAVELQGRQAGRRAIVMFTDGEDRHSHVSLSEAERRLETSDSVLFLIGLGQGASVPSLKAVLDRLSRRSGGRAFYTDRASRLNEPFTHIVQELSHQYLLGYSSTNAARDGTWRTIQVEMSDKDLRVRARQGYRAVPRGEAER